MDSKEALGILYSKADTTYECWECRQTIEKDLEVLKLLKENTILYEDKTQGSGYIDSNGNCHCETYTYYFLNGRETSKETYTILKEWLENEKIY